METHTIVGVFDNDVQAQRAVERLVEWGFTRDNVHVTSTATIMVPAAIAPHADTLENRIRNLFSRLGGGKARHEELSYYSEAVRRGGVMVTVTSGSEEGADSAADILNEHGAVDIDVQERYLRDSAWQGSPMTTDSAASTTGVAGNERVVPVDEQEMQGSEGRRDKGGVRIYTRTNVAFSK
jgi:precorrin-6B methylase 2